MYIFTKGIVIFLMFVLNKYMLLRYQIKYSSKFISKDFKVFY